MPCPINPANDSTAVSPPVISAHSREQAAAWLLADAHQHIADPLTSPALDCTDLAERLRTNADAAYADLARLDLAQLTLQAICYASYANELLGLELRGDDVLAFWGVALARRALGRDAA